MQDRISTKHFGVEADGQRPPPVLQALPDAAHDQHLHARRRVRAGGHHPLRRPRASTASPSPAARSNISNGDFVFSVTEGYMIEDGKITAPIRNVNLIGNGPDVLTQGHRRRQRLRAQRRPLDLRQGRPVRARRRRHPDGARLRHDRRRHEDGVAATNRPSLWVRRLEWRWLRSMPLPLLPSTR